MQTALATTGIPLESQQQLGRDLDTVHDPEDDFISLTHEADGISRGPGAADMKGGLLVAIAALEALDAEVVVEGRVFDSIEKGLKKLRKELVEKRKSVKRYRNGEVRQKLEIVAEQLGTLRGAVKKCLLRVHPDKVGSTSVAEMAETVSKLLTPLLDGSVYPMPPPKL